MMLAIYGPTVTGKTDLGITLAKKFNGEIISADSRQVYKGLDIGTGKANLTSQVEKHKGYWIVDGIKIHGFDLVKPGDSFSVADFLKFASDTMIRITRTDKLPIVVGGTGFYIKALIDGVKTVGIPQNPKLRQKLENLSVADLYQELLAINPDRARGMNESDRQNPRRLIRAIEIALSIISTSEESEPTSEVSISQKPTVKGKLSNVNCLIIGLTAPNPYLYQRADQWLNTRLEQGMIEEVKKLLEQKISPKWLDDLGLEYRWLSRFLLGKINKLEAIERLKGDIHSFIRRQKTWFRKFNSVELYDISQSSWQKRLENKVRFCYTQSNV